MDEKNLDGLWMDIAGGSGLVTQQQFHSWWVNSGLMVPSSVEAIDDLDFLFRRGLRLALPLSALLQIYALLWQYQGPVELTHEGMAQAPRAVFGGACCIAERNSP
jgi:hypothetical protein